MMNHFVMHRKTRVYNKNKKTKHKSRNGVGGTVNRNTRIFPIKQFLKYLFFHHMMNCSCSSMICLWIQWTPIIQTEFQEAASKDFPVVKH